jgi:hypothetical protein
LVKIVFLNFKVAGRFSCPPKKSAANFWKIKIRVSLNDTKKGSAVFAHHLIIKNPMILGILKTKKCAFVALPKKDIEYFEAT